MHTKRTSPRFFEESPVAPTRSKKGIAATDPAGTLKRIFLFVSAISKWHPLPGVVAGARILYATVKSGAPNIQQFFTRRNTRGKNTSHFALQATRGEDRLAFCTANSRASLRRRKKKQKKKDKANTRDSWLREFGSETGPVVRPSFVNRIFKGSRSGRRKIRNARALSH